MCSDMAWLDKEHLKWAVVVSQGTAYSANFSGKSMCVVQLLLVELHCYFVTADCLDLTGLF